MKCACAGLAALVFAAAGCATVDEAKAPPEPAEPPPQVAVVQPAPAPETKPPSIPEAVSPPVTPQPSRASQVERLVVEFARLRRLPGPDIVREQEDARQEFNQTRSDSARIRLAMTLAIPGSATDEARALELLDPLVKTPGASLHALAVLMSSHIQDQRRLTAQVNGLQQHVQGLQQNVQGLQQKLDAIKSLERSLSGRGEAARRR